MPLEQYLAHIKYCISISYYFSYHYYSGKYVALAQSIAPSVQCNLDCKRFLPTFHIHSILSLSLNPLFYLNLNSVLKYCLDFLYFSSPESQSPVIKSGEYNKYTSMKQSFYFTISQFLQMFSRLLWVISSLPILISGYK